MRTAGAESQLRLRRSIAAGGADECAAAGMTAVVQDLYFGPDLPPFLGQWSDTAALGVDATAEQVLARLDEARLDLPLGQRSRRKPAIRSAMAAGSQL